MALFIWQVAVPAFLPALEGLKSFGLLRTLLERYDEYMDLPEEITGYVPAWSEDPAWAKLAKEKPTKRLQTARSWLMLKLLLEEREGWDARQKKAIERLAKSYQKLAEKWEIKLPKNWLTRAAEFDSMEVGGDEEQPEE